MAGFKAHLTSGAFLGIFIASMGFFSKALTPVQAGAIFIVGAIFFLIIIYVFPSLIYFF